MKNMKNTNVKTPKTYVDKVHTWGKIWTILAILALFAVPLIFTLWYKAYPPIDKLLAALLTLIPVYWSSAIIEVITYTPMLGAGGTYLSFVTGNITNLKLPCALSAMDRANVKSNSEEGEVISTLAIGASSITTTVIIAVGVLLFGSSISKLTAPGSLLEPAFRFVVPALFGALGASYFLKHWKLSIFPILVGVIVYIFTPTMGVGTMIFVTIVASVGGAFVMWKAKLVK